MLEGRVGLDQFSADRFGDEGVVHAEVAAVLPRIHVTVREDLTRKYPAQWPTHVRLTLPGSSVEQGMNDYPRGNPENPVSTAVLEDKFLALVAPRYGEQFARRALDTVRAVGESADVQSLFAELFATQ